ncbi:uncharacterized protein [Linepithema humile]|uniref:uncharacterized protein n=1 Tax=Linepithema humile TaxID=83485 RepID=UPI00351F2315
MTCLKKRYLDLNRILLLAVGLWPYQRSIFVRLQLILFYSIVISFIVFQFTAFMTLKCTLQIIIEVCSNAFFFIICFLKYNSFFFNMDIIKHFVELLQHIHDELRDEGEVAIVENYWIIAKRCNGLLILLGLLSCCYPLCLPQILDTIYFTNESKSSSSLYIMTEYFIDKEKYSFLILLHWNVAYFVALTALLAPGTMNIMYFMHVCGMFKIASYRIEQAMTKINLKTNNVKNINIVYMGIVYAVDMHRKAMYMIQLLVSAFHVFMIFIFGIAVLSASLYLFRIFQEITSGCDVKKLVSPVLFLSIMYMYLSLCCILSQQITDHNKDLFVTVYSVQWYKAPLHIQRLILFLLQRGTKQFNLMLAGCFVGCLEGLGTKGGDERTIPNFLVICVWTSEEMTYLETQYFGLNRILLLTLGIWPYKKSTFVRFKLILLYSILASFIIFQFTALVTSKCTPQIIIEVFSSAFFFISCIIKYSAYCFNLDIMKHLLEVLEKIYDELTDKSEIAILEKYWIISSRFTGVLTLLAIGLLSCLSLSFLPIIFDAASNESQSHTPQIITEYFIDKEQYSYLIILHMNVSFFIAVIAILATGTMNNMYLLVACGMFKIASYRIKQAMMEKNLNTSKTKNINMIYTGIVEAVDMHRKAMQIVTLLMSTMNLFMTFLIGALVISASLNLFRIFQEITAGFDIKKIILPFLFLNVIYIYMLFANVIAQQIMDHNNDIFVTTYSVQWYIAPLRIQKLILFLLQRGTKQFNLMLAGCFVGCLEGLGTLITASVSYFTFIYSTNRM